MNITSANAIQNQEVTRTNGLRKAAGAVQPPKLTEDESSMIRKEFSETKPITFYKGNGETQQQIVAGRGRHLDTLV